MAKKVTAMIKLHTVLAMVLCIIFGQVAYDLTLPKSPTVEINKETLVVADAETQENGTTEAASCDEATNEPTIQEQIANALDDINNPDVNHWIVIPELGISQPVAMSSDNVDYLYADANKNYCREGSIFFDYLLNDLDAANTVIYGHNFGEGSEEMFSVLPHLLTKGEIDTRVFIYTRTEVYEYEIKLLRVTTTADAVYCNDFSNFEIDSTAFQDAVNSWNNAAAVKYGDLDASKPVVTLSTCYRQNGANGRFVVQMQ
jgi:SrtB family sortase